ncbi:MAG: NAD(P)-dependent oxidoreductase [Leeuwenhoekiella sp.]
MFYTTFALIQERKEPLDERVVLSPIQLREAQDRYPRARFIIEPSRHRIFPKVVYEKAEFDVTEDLAEADVLIGVKEVPIEALVAGKKYMFFSHTIKKQPYNRDLLRAVLEKNIELYDHEALTAKSGLRLVGFGRYAGLVGAYNGIRAFCLREKIIDLPKVVALSGMEAMFTQLAKVKLPNIKIALTGSGRVAQGAVEVLEIMNIEKVSVEDYLNKSFDHPVYTQLYVMDYNKRKDGNPGSAEEFINDPTPYISDFKKYTTVSDLFIAGHFYGEGAPYLFTREDAKADDFNINTVADISCDIDGPVASTIRSSSIQEPLYGYDPKTEKEVAFDAPGAITVMAVDNLPCELPRNASEGFGEMFLNNVLPAFFDGDSDGILERARVTQNGQLTERFSYLQDYVDGKE